MAILGDSQVLGSLAVDDIVSAEIIMAKHGILFYYNNYQLLLNLNMLTANRNLVLPNKDGTIAVIEDMPTINDGALELKATAPLNATATEFSANYSGNKKTFNVSHATSGVIAGIYNSVKVDQYGHVTAGNSVDYSETFDNVVTKDSKTKKEITTSGYNLGTNDSTDIKAKIVYDPISKSIKFLFT